MQSQPRRIVTGHDQEGRSIVLSDDVPPQDHAMTKEAIGADFIEMWNSADPVPTLTAQPDGEPSLRPFTIMPASGHLIRQIVLHPASEGGERTVMHRTRTLDYATVIEGEVTLHLTDSSVTLGPGSVVVQNGTDHAWENLTDRPARMLFVHIAAEFADDLRARLPEDLQLME